METFIIKSIKHSGRKGIRGTDVDNPKYDGLVGSKCEIDIDAIEQFKPYSFRVFSPTYDWWRISEVLTIVLSSTKEETTLRIETINAIYIFKEVEK